MTFSEAREGQPELSVVIPAFNEERRLPPSLRQIEAYLRASDRHSELIVVDDGSSDGTAEAVDGLIRDGLRLHLLRHQNNQGKGAAVRTGIMAATGRLVLFTDADLSTPIADLERLVQALDAGADVAIGSRAIDRSLIEVHQPLHRETMGRIFNKFVQVVLLPGIRDTQCGFKAFHTEAARQLFSTMITTGFDFDAEILYRARRRNMRIAEVAVHWRNSPDSRVSAIRDSVGMFLSLFRVRRRVR
ncbi:MAG TPA: dolichyl-phosphate beta-glucosyltransferase [Candidatus Dormibacteraeota bacterium]|jgi:dolichyl-phosphate beta-glucosyltransferase|nr:dolichyl-phosphate beta-glucosyltransferase [Candidatus Dormibacteraeota bacterium]